MCWWWRGGRGRGRRGAAEEGGGGRRRGWRGRKLTGQHAHSRMRYKHPFSRDLCANYIGDGRVRLVLGKMAQKLWQCHFIADVCYAIRPFYYEKYFGIIFSRLGETLN